MIQGDSYEYELITKGMLLSEAIEGMCLEIGLRLGMGTKTIIDASWEQGGKRKVVSVDPYGSILYAIKENVEPCRLDYTNIMKLECLALLYSYLLDKPVPYQFFNMTDGEYFNRFTDGVKWYDLEEVQETKYSFVHFDGPHTANDVMREVMWFQGRTNSGSCYVFDDISECDFFYSHHIVHDWLLGNEWVMVEKGSKKTLYQKI